MGSKLSRSLICGLAMGLSSNLLAQGEVEFTEDAAQMERQARIAELRELIKEDRQARRQDIEERLSNLSEDERAALQERRRMARQARARRSGPRRGGYQPCDCNEVQADDSPS